ncbi:MAG: cell division protein ZapA [Proteobacteria bacterium]|jgi:cell division protein ZapA (FtsZ GTPase activity inhibitor)|nr:cell division protein ZapA [Pseudomonadota bacterium]NBP14938.1 cell division protein ZapA [bacterium]
MKSKQTVNVSIFDETYSLVTDELESHLMEAARLVDDQMRAISKAGIKDVQKIGVLVALQLASKYLKEQDLLQKNTEAITNVLDRLDLQNKLLSDIL